MANKNEVNLTFAGDHAKLTKSFEAVGTSARSMSDEVGSASKKIGDETTEAFSRTGAAVDGTYNSFDGLESLGRGTSDTMSGLADIMAGNVLQGATDLTGGIAALASGFRDALLPALKTIVQTKISDVAATTKSIAANVAHKTALIATSVATKAMAAAQWILNAAMRANPIGIVITLIAGLVAGIVIAYKRSETFRNIVQGAMRAVGTAFRWVVDKGKGLINWFKDLPGKIRRAVSNIGSIISSPFRAAWNLIRSGWNSTIGGKGFSITIPDFVPKWGGNSYGFRIPYMHTGGIVPGAPGQEVLTMLEAGERVTPRGRAGSGMVLELRSSGNRIDDLLLEVLRHSIRVKGGNVQVVLGT